MIKFAISLFYFVGGNDFFMNRSFQNLRLQKHFPGDFENQLNVFVNCFICFTSTITCYSVGFSEVVAYAIISGRYINPFPANVAPYFMSVWFMQ